MNDAVKPLGQRAYGSIAHLPGSRMGPGDHACHEGQARIACERVRDRHDRVYVQEKLDGSCTAVAKINGTIVPLIRAGYLAADSVYPQHHRFAEWVEANRLRFVGLLNEGERACGEWLYQAHGTRYDLTGREPWVLFDIMRRHDRLATPEVRERAMAFFPVPALLAEGPTPIEEAMRLLGTYGHYGAIDPVEGCVWRVERDGVVDFLVKYVRPDKVDGLYLESHSGVTVLNDGWQ